MAQTKVHAVIAQAQKGLEIFNSKFNTSLRVAAREGYYFYQLMEGEDQLTDWMPHDLMAQWIDGFLSCESVLRDHARRQNQPESTAVVPLKRRLT